MAWPGFLKQKNMLRVLYALAPVAAVAVYFFGWRVAAIMAVTVAACFLTEWYMVVRRNGKVSYACFVTAALLGLSFPPAVPLWIPVVAGIVAILFAKEAFGGFGKNVFNPAVVGRAFVYVCFPVEMTSWFTPVFSGIPGGFARWSFAGLRQAPTQLARAGLGVADALSAATPMWARRDYGYSADIWSLLTGNISGVFESGGRGLALSAGSVGEVCAVVIVLSALYLIFTKTAQWRLMVSTLAGALMLNVVLRHGLQLHDVPPVLFTLTSGALLYGAVFMVTDPVSAPKQKVSQWIYGAFVGAMIVFLRYKAIFAGGVAFAILLGNTLAPSLDLWLKRLRAPRSTA